MRGWGGEEMGPLMGHWPRKPTFHLILEARPGALLPVPTLPLYPPS